MKTSERILAKLNNLLIMNYETEKVYLEALELAAGDNLKAFFRERGFERNEFSKRLKAEIIKLNGKPVTFNWLSSTFDKKWHDFKIFLLWHKLRHVNEWLLYCDSYPYYGVFWK